MTLGMTRHTSFGDCEFRRSLVVGRNPVPRARDSGYRRASVTRR